MRRVAIIGVGITPRNREYLRDADRKSWKEYVVEAAYGAIADVDKGMDPKDIQYVVVNYHGEATVEAGGIGPVVSDILGLHPVGVTALSANCVGAGVSTHEAFGLVASGRYDRVLVVGFDKQFDLLSPTDKRAMATDVDFDFNFGFDHLHEQAILQQLDCRKYGVRTIVETAAAYAIQMYWYANRNPNAALYGIPCPVKSKEELMAIWELSPGSNQINPEFWKRLPRSVPAEGASALIVVPAEHAKRYTDKPIYIDGIAYKSSSHLLSSQMYYPVPSLATFDAADFAAARLAVEEAYQMAKVEPRDIDFAEVFDGSYIVPTIATLQATKVPPEGQAPNFIISGETAIGGRLPMGTDGGRRGFGAPSGSDISDAIYEAVVQMRGKAGERQVPKTDVCVIVGQQGVMASSAALVLRRD